MSPNEPQLAGGAGDMAQSGWCGTVLYSTAELYRYTEIFNKSALYSDSVL